MGTYPQLNDIKNIYIKLQDDKSKNIYLNRLKMNITQDKRYLFAENDDKISKIIFNHDPNIPIIIYGTGNNADYVYNILNQFISITCFCDEKFDENNFHNGLPIISVDELVKNYKDSVILLLSDNTEINFFYKLMKHGFKTDQIITFALSGIEYFGLPCFKPGDNEIFIDAGAFTGDTIINFLKWCDHKYKKIYAIEPDTENCKKLKSTIINKNINNVHIYEQGVWNNKGYLNFNNNGSVGSKITPEGETAITVDTIDNIVGNDPITFIKLDVEGAELEALEGAKNTIERNKPRIAVCIYHKPEDFIEIPLYIMNNFPYYNKFYIRKYSYGWDYYDIVLYAIVQ